MTGMFSAARLLAEAAEFISKLRDAPKPPALYANRVTSQNTVAADKRRAAKAKRKKRK